jgi:integrase
MSKYSTNIPGIRKTAKSSKYRIDYYDWDGVHRTKIFHGKLSDAKKVRQSLIAKADRIKNGLELPDYKKEVITFEKLWERFYDDYQMHISTGSKKIATLKRYANAYNALINFKPIIAHQDISQLSDKNIEEFKVHRIDFGLSKSGVNTDLRSLKVIFNYANKNNLIKTNIMNNVPYIKINNIDVRFLDEKEMEKISKIIPKLDLNNPYVKDGRDLFLFYLFTGARAKEVLYPYLNWDCIGKNSISFTNTKRSGFRKIPMTKTLIDILKSRGSIIGGPFFTVTNRSLISLDELKNSHMTYDMAYRRTVNIFKLAGISNASVHTLRKTAGAYYYMATKDIFAASKFLGHSSVNVTESHYVGLMQSMQSKYSNQFDEFLASNIGKI